MNVVTGMATTRRLAVRRNIGLAAGAICAIGLGIMAAGYTPTRMVGVAPDKPESLAWQPEEPAALEATAEYFGGGDGSNWFASSTTSVSPVFPGADDYYPADETNYAEPGSSLEAQFETDDPFATAMNDETAETAASAEQVARDVGDALAEPVIQHNAGTEPTPVPAVTEPNLHTTAGQFAGVQR